MGAKKTPRDAGIGGAIMLGLIMLFIGTAVIFFRGG